MNQSKLHKEGEKWVKDGIITEEQLEQIVKKYDQNEHNYMLVLFAVVLMSIGVLIFVFTDWAQVPHLSRLLIMVISTLLLYGFGHYFYRKTIPATALKKDIRLSNPSRIYGMSFILLSFIFFGGTLLLIVNMYTIELNNVWPFVIWSFIGLLLYMFYQHRLLFILGITVTIFAQLYSALAFESFNLWIAGIVIIGYTYYAYMRSHPLISYLFAIALSIQALLFTVIYMEQYYWYMFFILIGYAISEITAKHPLKQALLNISIISIFMLKIYETFVIQNESFLNMIEFQLLFVIAIAVIFVFVAVSKWMQLKTEEWIDLLLFLPLLFLPHAHLLILISLFIYSVFWLVVGFQNQMDDKIKIGITTFILSTCIAYFQFAWEAFNKSLFFLIGGLFLFILSFLLEKQRRATKDQQKE